MAAARRARGGAARRADRDAAFASRPGLPRAPKPAMVARILRSVANMRITRIRAYQVDLPLREGSYQWSGGNAVSVFDRRSSRSTPTPASRATARYVRSAPRIFRRTRPVRAPASPSLRPADREGPARSRAPQPDDGRGAARPSVRQVSARHGLLGPARQGSRRCRCARCSAGGTASFALYRAISQESPDEMARRVAEYGRRATPVPAQGRRRPGHRHREGPGRARATAGRRGADR